VANDNWLCRRSGRHQKPSRIWRWRNGKEIFIGKARRLLENTSDGRRIDKAVSTPIFGEDEYHHWLARRYKKLCAYTHGNPGHTNMDLCGSNGPIFVDGVLRRVEDELRETLALAYLLLVFENSRWAGVCLAENR
jgi:hypothetical protein